MNCYAAVKHPTHKHEANDTVARVPVKAMPSQRRSYAEGDNSIALDKYNGKLNELHLGRLQPVSFTSRMQLEG